MMRAMRKFLALLFFLSPLSCWAQEGYSGQVSLSVASSCRIDSTANIDFGLYDPLGIHSTQAAYATGDVAVVCTKGTGNVRVGLREGSYPNAGSSCDAPSRRMRSASGGVLDYSIYQDASRQMPWGCGVGNEVVLPMFDGSLMPVHVPTYGALPPGQDARMGDYRDTVEVVVEF